jgi:hypothetical protein
MVKFRFLSRLVESAQTRKNCEPLLPGPPFAMASVPSV